MGVVVWLLIVLFLMASRERLLCLQNVLLPLSLTAVNTFPMSFWGHLIVSSIHSLWLSVITWTRPTRCVMVFKSSYAASLFSIFSLLFIARSLVLPVYLHVGVSVCASHTLCFRGGSYSGFPPSESANLELTNSPVGYYLSLLLNRKEDLQLMADHFLGPS